MQKTSETLQLFSPQTLQEQTLSLSVRLASISALLESVPDSQAKKVTLSSTQLPSLLASDQVYLSGRTLKEYSPNAGADFWAILQAFANIGGYRLEWQLLNTSWLLPQNRQRIYLVGHLAGRSISGVFPIQENDFISTKKTQSQSQMQISGTIKANGNMNADDTYIIPKTASTLTGGGHSGGLHSDMTVIQQRSRGKNKGADLTICPTISSNAFQENNLLCGVRRLTEIECERLQGFPDNWTQYGNYNGRKRRISKTQRYKLIGNAVTVDIVELIAKRLKITRNE